MVDQPATVRASGLQPNERVTIRAELADGAGEQWTSQADFAADAQGNVDTSRQAPVAGSGDVKPLACLGAHMQAPLGIKQRHAFVAAGQQ